MRKWYEFKAQAEPGTAELHIFDAIARSDPWGDGLITSKQFVRDLAALGSDVKTIRVHINSPGGDAFAAIAIANALREQRVTKGRTVETIVDGMAASAASLILMAGSPIKISDNAMVMIHNPWTIAMGNAADLLKAAADLESIKGALVATYRWHSQLEESEIGALMDAETWMDAEEAVANGFADEIVPGLQAQASIDPAVVARLHVPERFSARVAALTTARAMGDMCDPNAPKVGDRVRVVIGQPHMPGHEEGIVRQAIDGALGIEFDSAPGEVHHWYVPSEVMVTDPSAAPMEPGMRDASKPKMPEKKPQEPMMTRATLDEIVALCRPAGLDLEFAARLSDERIAPEAVAARVAAEKAARDAEARRQSDIRALCDLGKVPLLADELVASGASLEGARAIVAKVTGMVDRVELDAGLLPASAKGAGTANDLSPEVVYAKRRKGAGRS